MVEQCLLAGLENIFTSASIGTISPEKLEAVAGESQDSKAERIRLTAKLEELEAGLKIINEESPRGRFSYLGRIINFSLCLLNCRRYVHALAY